MWLGVNNIDNRGDEYTTEDEEEEICGSDSGNIDIVDETLGGRYENHLQIV